MPSWCLNEEVWITQQSHRIWLGTSKTWPKITRKLWLSREKHLPFFPQIYSIRILNWSTLSSFPKLVFRPNRRRPWRWKSKQKNRRISCMFLGQIRSIEELKFWTSGPEDLWFLRIRLYCILKSQDKTLKFGFQFVVFLEDQELVHILISKATRKPGCFQIYWYPKNGWWK